MTLSTPLLPNGQFKKILENSKYIKKTQSSICAGQRGARVNCANKGIL